MSVTGPDDSGPFNSRIHPGGWRQFLDYGNGQLGDWGVHWLDQVLMWTDEKAPKRIFSSTNVKIAAIQRGGRRCRIPRTASRKQNAAGTSGQILVA